MKESNADPDSNPKGKTEKSELKLERGIGRMSAIMMCFNGIVGSGIFVSPKGKFSSMIYSQLK